MSNNDLRRESDIEAPRRDIGRTMLPPMTQRNLLKIGGFIVVLLLVLIMAIVSLNNRAGDDQVDAGAVQQSILKELGFPVDADCVPDVKVSERKLWEGMQKIATKKTEHVAAGILLIYDGLKKLPDVLRACNSTEVSLVKTFALMRQLGAETIVINVAEDVELNGVAVGKEIKDAQVAWDAGNSSAFGNSVGQLLQEVLAPRSDPGRPDFMSILVGVMEGVGFDLIGIEDCVAASRDEAASVDAAIELMKKHREHSGEHDVKKGLKALATALAPTPNVIHECTSAGEEAKDTAQKFRESLAMLSQPKGFAFLVGTHILVNGRNIFKQIVAALKAWDNREWELAGNKIGEALVEILVGDAVVAVV